MIMMYIDLNIFIHTMKYLLVRVTERFVNCSPVGHSEKIILVAWDIIPCTRNCSIH